MSEGSSTSSPKAIRAVPFRILIFYILDPLGHHVPVPWYSVTKANSPFVQIFEGLGIPAAASILNVVIITAAISALNADVMVRPHDVRSGEAEPRPRILCEGYQNGAPWMTTSPWCWLWRSA